MSIWAITLGLAVVIVLVTRGSYFALARMRLRGLWMLIGAGIIQIALEFVSIPEARIEDVGFGFLMASYVLLLGFCAANLGLRGMGVVAIGVTMNTLVIGLNQGMPAIEDTWRDGEVVEEPFERTVKHKPATDDDLLGFLGDIILLPEPFNEVISFGDLVLAIGVIDVAFWGSRKRRRKTAEEEADERAMSGASRRRRRRARRRRRRDDDVLAPEPVFIDLTEPEFLSDPEPATATDLAEPTDASGSSNEASDDAASPSERPPIEWRAPPRSAISLSGHEQPPRARPRG